METTIGSRFKRAFNAFMNRSPTEYMEVGVGSYSRPDRARLTSGKERTIVTALYNRIALDVSAIPILHVQLDEDGRYEDTKKSVLNERLTLEANIDQTWRALTQDAILSLCDEGVIAIVPIDTDLNVNLTDSYDILSWRVGKIIEWYPKKVKVRLYNDRTGLKEDIIVNKNDCAIIENPFYAVMNESNSTAQRLIRKLYLLDAVDEQNSSGKLDLIIQLPYTIKTETRRQQADKRRKEIEMQLTGSKYGIAYTDGTERITQLNRPVENNLIKHVEYLTSMLFSQLNMTQGILDGTADDKTMLNYTNRIVKVFLNAIVDELKRKFLTKTARTQGQSIMYFIDPFERMSVESMADASDKFTRNEIMSTNEVRQKIFMKPSKDPKADQLLNKNINHPEEQPPAPEPQVPLNDEIEQD